MRRFCYVSPLKRSNFGALTKIEDDVGVLTLSSRAGNGQNSGKTFHEDGVGVLTLSSQEGGALE